MSREGELAVPGLMLRFSGKICSTVHSIFVPCMKLRCRRQWGFIFLMCQVRVIMLLLGLPYPLKSSTQTSKGPKRLKRGFHKHSARTWHYFLCRLLRQTSNGLQPVGLDDLLSPFQPYFPKKVTTGQGLSADTRVQCKTAIHLLLSLYLLPDTLPFWENWLTCPQWKVIFVYVTQKEMAKGRLPMFDCGWNMFCTVIKLHRNKYHWENQ